MWNSSCRTKRHSSVPRQPSHGGVSLLAESKLICEPLMRILDHLPPIKMLSKEPCTCSRHATLALYRACRALRRVLQHSIAGHTDITTLAAAHPPPGKPCYHQHEGIQDSVGCSRFLPVSASKQAEQCCGVSTGYLIKLVRIHQLTCPQSMATNFSGICADQPTHEC